MVSVVALGACFSGESAKAQSVGSITGNGSANVNGTTVSGAGTATATGTGSISLAGPGRVTATVNGTVTGSGTLSGVALPSSLSITGTLNGTGTVTLPGKGTITGSGTATGTGALVATNPKTGAVSFNGVGSVSVTGVLTGSTAFVDPTSIAANAVSDQTQDMVEQRRERALYLRSGGGTASANGPTAYAPDATSQNGGPASSLFGGLNANQFAALNDSSLPTRKGPIAAAAAPGVTFATWASGTFDYENTSGTYLGQNIGNTSRSWSGLAGGDWTAPLPGGAYFLGGILGGETFISIAQADGTSTSVKAPTVGAYAAYLIGPYSVDALYTATWIGASSTVPAGTINQNALSHNVALNLQYRYALADNWYVEPTAGGSWTYTFEGASASNERLLRLQGGLRAGTTAKWGTVTVEPTFTGLLYSDVIADGGAQIVGFAPVAADRGQLWAKGVAKLNFVWSPNFSSYLQGEIHGTDGTEKVVGVVATAGLRWVF